MPNEATSRAPRTLRDFIGPVVVVGAVVLIVHVVRPEAGTMFDDDNFGGTVVLGMAAIVAAVVGVVVTRATLRRVALRGPCPSCGAMALRGFASPADPTSLPTQCGTCIAYLRATEADEVREETDAQVQHLAVKFPYALRADQYMPAVQHTNRRFFTFEMPPMCATCGDPNATHKRDINDGDHFGDGLVDLASSGHAPGRVGAAPSSPTQDDKNSQGLSNLKAPVCEKHTESADTFGDVIGYSSGKLEFASYRYYKAFCDLNNITRASVKA